MDNIIYQQVNSNKWIAIRRHADGSLSRAATAEWNGEQWQAARDPQLNGQRFASRFPQLALMLAAMNEPGKPATFGSRWSALAGPDNGLAVGIDY